MGSAKHWGMNSIGWNLGDLDNLVTNGPDNGVTFPCTITIYQGMQIMCNANTWWQYRVDTIQIIVDDDHTEENCRGGVCGELVSFSYRIGGQSKTWARVWHRNDLGATMEATQ
jgi:hypothetical protein